MTNYEKYFSTPEKASDFLCVKSNGLNNYEECFSINSEIVFNVPYNKQSGRLLKDILTWMNSEVKEK